MLHAIPIRAAARESRAEYRRTTRPAREQEITLLGLGDPVRAQHLDRARRQRHRAPAVRRLRLRLDPRAGRSLLDRLHHPQQAGVQVDVRPG
jgi:hypothetical protein